MARKRAAVEEESEVTVSLPISPFVPQPIRGMDVIGISGKAGSGKSWLATVLGQWGWRPFHLAWHLKADAQKVGWSYEDAHHNKPPEMREWLQVYGTEENRDVHGEDCWLRTTYGWLRILREQYGFQRIVIPDVRFENEARFVHDMGGQVFRMDLANREYLLADTDAASHRSETSLDEYLDFDVLLINKRGYKQEDALKDIGKQGGRIF